MVFKNGNGYTYSFHAKKGMVAEKVIVVGSPDRVKVSRKFFSSIEHEETNRGYHYLTGTYKNELVTVGCTGVGPASSNLMLMEMLSNIEGRNIKLIRTGTCGSLQEYVKPGAFVVTTASIRDEGATAKIVSWEYPAIASFQCVSGIVTVLEKRGYKEGSDYFVGVTHCKDDLYFVENFKDTPLEKTRKEHIESYVKMGALATEMEFSSVSIISQYFSAKNNCTVNCGGVFQVVSPYNPDGDGLSFISANDEGLLEIGFESLLIN